MLTVQNIKDSFERYKRDISDVTDATFIEWVQFTARYIYEQVKKIDAERFVKTNSYNVVIPPQKFTLPTDFENLNQTACGIYKYDMRKRSIVTFDSTGDSDVTFTDTGGTSAYNTAIYVQGGSSRGFTGDAAATLNLTFGTAIDFDDFDGGGATSPSNDYISVWVYVGNSVPTSATLGFYSTSAKTNGWTYAYTALVAGWNRIKVAKSSFTEVGTGDWSSIGYIELTYAGGAATTNVYWDKLDLVENEVNGNDETDEKLGLTGYGSKNEGYYLVGSTVVFTGTQQIQDYYYVMRYLPIPPPINALTDYLTVDGTASTAEIAEDRHLEYFVKAIDVLYEQWDASPGSESLADFRFARALGGILDGFNRQPQISVIARNYFSDY